MPRSPPCAPLTPYCAPALADIVCHGIPDDNLLREGDLVNVDVTCFYGGYHGDLSETFAVGRVDAEGRRLVRVTHAAWQKAIAVCAPGVPYKAIGAAIEAEVEGSGFSIVRGFVGHGIGHAFHMPPNVVHHRCGSAPSPGVAPRARGWLSASVRACSPPSLSGTRTAMARWRWGTPSRSSRWSTRERSP